MPLIILPNLRKFYRQNKQSDFVMFSAYVFITNVVAKIFCPDKQID